jgi:hypothetical protein
VVSDRFKNYYSTSVTKIKQNFLCNVLNKLNISNYNNDEATQRYIEKVLYYSFEEVFLLKDKEVLIGGINKDLLDKNLHQYIINKTPELLEYINKLLNPDKPGKDKDLFLNEVLSRLNKDFVYNLCLVNFLQIYTNQHSENDKDYVLLPVGIKMGKKMVSFYFNSLKDLHVKNHGLESMLYSEYKVI